MFLLIYREQFGYSTTQINRVSTQSWRSLRDTEGELEVTAKHSEE